MLLDPTGTAPQVSTVMAQAVEATSLVAYVGAPGRSSSPSPRPTRVSVALAAGVIGFGLHAARPERGSPAWSPPGSSLALIWLQLGQADVTTVEAYTLPAGRSSCSRSAWSARPDRTAGRRARHRRGSPSARPWWWRWPRRCGCSFANPGSVRPLVGLVAGAVVLVGGVTWGKRALVDVGAATVVILGLAPARSGGGGDPQLGRRIGATGIVLLAVGATFEQRRRDLKAVLRSTPLQ